MLILTYKIKALWLHFDSNILNVKVQGRIMPLGIRWLCKLFVTIRYWNFMEYIWLNLLKEQSCTLFRDFWCSLPNLEILLQELPDVPLFLSLHNLCATLKCTSPSAVIFRSAVINAGYRISGTHVNPLGLKSDAPMDVIWDIMRCWVRAAFLFLNFLRFCWHAHWIKFKQVHLIKLLEF